MTHLCMRNAIEPETIRLPRVGSLCPHTGLTRAALNELILPTERNGFKPVVDSYVLKKKGARTGIRLISFSSLMEHIKAHKQQAGRNQLECAEVSL